MQRLGLALDAALATRIPRIAAKWFITDLAQLTIFRPCL